MVNLILIPFFLLMNTLTIYEFNNKSIINDWQIVDDNVMGGISSSSISINKNGNGLFKGTVSLANNGGFSSVRHRTKAVILRDKNHFIIRIKGDGKNFQFRVKSSISEQHSYKYTFSTNGQWQEIKIPFNTLSPTYRGRNLRIPNFQGQNLEEVCFLISNKKEESFNLEIDYIKAN